MKRLLALLLAAIMLMSCSIVVTAVESSSIELDQLYTVVFTENYKNEKFNYSFSPNETDYYIFESFSIEDGYGKKPDPFVAVYDDNGDRIGYNDDVKGLDFAYACKLEKGKTYNIEIMSHHSGTLNFGVKIPKLSEDFSIRALEHYTFIAGTDYNFYADANEEYDVLMEGDWSVSNDEVAETFYQAATRMNSSWGNVQFLKSGKTNVTYTSANGKSDTVEVTVIDPIELTTDKASDFYVLPEQYVLFKFVPETSGYYNIYSESNEDFEAELFIYNEEIEGLEYVTENEDSGQGYNFKVVEELEAGKEYYIQVYGYDGAFGNITVFAEKAIDPSSIDISEVDGLIIPTGEYFNVEVVLSPVDSNEIIDWSVSDETVLSLYNCDYNNNVASAIFKTLKEGTVTITATTVNGISDTATIYVCNELTLEEDIPYDAKIEGDAMYEFSFTPKYDGAYIFYSVGDYDVDGFLYDNRGSNMGSNYDSGVGDNFKIEKNLVAGENYTLDVRASEYGIIPVTICASRANGNATSVIIEKDSDVLTYGELSNTPISAYSAPLDAKLEKVLTWTSSNDDVAYVDDGCLYFMSEGTATITVTTENGLTDSIDVVVTKTPELIVNMANEAVCLYGDKIVYEFTPKLSGSYTLYSLGDDNPAMSLYNKNMEEIGESDNEGEKLNFYLEADLIAGETYYVEYRGYDDVTECTINIVYNDAIDGDINNDGEVNAKDTTQLRRCVATGWEINIITEIGDLKGDGTIDAKDVTILRRIVADGWDI